MQKYNFAQLFTFAPPIRFNKKHRPNSSHYYTFSPDNYGAGKGLKNNFSLLEKREFKGREDFFQGQAGDIVFSLAPYKNNRYPLAVIAPQSLYIGKPNFNYNFYETILQYDAQVLHPELARYLCLCLTPFLLEKDNGFFGLNTTKTSIAHNFNFNIPPLAQQPEFIEQQVLPYVQSYLQVKEALEQDLCQMVNHLMQKIIAPEFFVPVRQYLALPNATGAQLNKDNFATFISQFTSSESKAKEIAKQLKSEQYKNVVNHYRNLQKATKQLIWQSEMLLYRKLYCHVFN
ncbi:hypothetical protein CJP74_00345 [Psittacicella melopsittaci]|uniref:Uncharacterized protein n=1 Tax=Psittacicella melopsittaci TaxID=2028576 RepID=A0A3A1YCX3_9GAMM|nr:hypothetical protein [Psittacicella melopsittaci]RIY34064.1 hypothetical protein CJP74_00345 [Psittacicella melopsittaci]